MNDAQPPCLIAPSILAADFAHLARDLDKVANADLIHVDIMDGHFVPNLSFGADMTAATFRSTELPLDVHLMIEDPARWVDEYIRAGAASIIFHVEATPDHVELAKYLRSQNIKAGISVKPGTPIEPYLADLEHIDVVLVMSVEPGFGGQSFMPEQLTKVKVLREYIDQHQLSTIIEIDGGISARTIAQAAAAGCDSFVAGSAVFGADDPHAEIETLRSLAQAARA